MAEKVAALSGELRSHFAGTSSCGVSAVVFGTSMRRRFACVVFGMSAFESGFICISHSMFDWPEASHTSPISTSCTLTLPAFSTCGSAFAGMGSSFTIHLPPASAFAVFFCPANSTTTSSPDAALPQTGTALSRCSTMWSVKMEGSRTSANDE